MAYLTPVHNNSFLGVIATAPDNIWKLRIDILTYIVSFSKSTSRCEVYTRDRRQGTSFSVSLTFDALGSYPSYHYYYCYRFVCSGVSLVDRAVTIDVSQS